MMRIRSVSHDEEEIGFIQRGKGHFCTIIIPRRIKVELFTRRSHVPGSFNDYVYIAYILRSSFIHDLHDQPTQYMWSTCSTSVL